MIGNCAHCRKPHGRAVQHVNRALKIGAPLYCDQKCAGLARRKNKTKAQKIAEKAAYDREYRIKNYELLQEKKREYFQITYDPVKAAIKRQKTMARHIEYCRRPEYKAWKSKYDLQLRASKFGQFSEAYLLLLQLDRELNTRATKEERRITNGTYNKAQFRKRDYQRLVGSQSQRRSMGNA